MTDTDISELSKRPEPLTPTSNGAVSLRRRYGGKTSDAVSNSKSGMRIGLYGPGGIGKTTLAATICDSELGSPALYLDARGNPEVVRSYGDDIQVMTIGTYSDIEAIRKDMIRDIQKGTCPFKSVILDNVSEMFALDLVERYGDDDVKWEMHSATTADILQLARRWSDMATIHGMNVVFILWETPEKRMVRGIETERSEVALNKSLQSNLPGIVSWLGRLYIVDEIKFTRCLDFRPIESLHQAKFQVDPKEPSSKLIPMEIYNPSLASILDTVKGGKPWPTKLHEKPSGMFMRKKQITNENTETKETE